MRRKPRFLHPSYHSTLPKTLEGKGQVLAAGLKPVKVTYSLTITRGDAQLSVLGALKGNIEAIKAAWLIPVITLRLENGERVDVTITEVSEFLALFAQAL